MANEGGERSAPSAEQIFNGHDDMSGGAQATRDDSSWIMRGLDWGAAGPGDLRLAPTEAERRDPFRIRTWRELINYINQVGFLPLFANEVPGFSVEDHVSNLFWLPCMQEKGPVDLFIAGRTIQSGLASRLGRCC